MNECGCGKNDRRLAGLMSAKKERMERAAASSSGVGGKSRSWQETYQTRVEQLCESVVRERAGRRRRTILQLCPGEDSDAHFNLNVPALGRCASPITAQSSDNEGGGSGP